MSERKQLQLLFGGDFAPVRRFEDLTSLPRCELFKDAKELIGQVDFSMVNLESPICSDLEPIKKSGPNLRASAGAIRALTEAGIESVCLANNHIFDYGIKGLSQTIKTLDQNGILYAGAGLDRNSAMIPLRRQIDGKQISIFCFSEREFNLSDDGQSGAAILDPFIIAPNILKERAQTDVIIVCFHGGNEFFPYPRPGLRKLCHFIIDIGADAVIGHHPHVSGPYEYYKEKPIVYSLGNLIFDTKEPKPGWDEGYFAAIQLAFDEAGLCDVGLNIHPFHQSIERGGVRLMQGHARNTFLDRIEEMRDCLESRPDDWLQSWRKFVGKKSGQATIDLSSPVRFRGLRHFMSFAVVRDLISPPSRRLSRLNQLRCPSHLEVIIESFENETSKIEGRPYGDKK